MFSELESTKTFDIQAQLADWAFFVRQDLDDI